MKEIKLTILMPCLNEEVTIPICIQKSKEFLKNNNIDGEILIVDNESIDNSHQIASNMGARVITENKKGYGNALIKGNLSAKGKYVVMLDCDDSYFFEDILPILQELEKGNDFIIGNRFKGKIEKGAMPFLHKYIGNPMLSGIGRRLYKIKEVKDWHCGIRGYSKEAILKMDLQATGMEYASEMIIKASKMKLKIAEVPVNLKQDSRNKKSHLRTVRDGFRHIAYLVSNINKNKL